MWHRGLGALWQVESSRTRDWTCVLTLADGFLITKLPGKSPQVQVWFCPDQLCSLHLPAASPMPLTPLLLPASLNPGSADLVLLFRLNHPLVTDPGLPWGSASSLGWASPLTRGLLLPSMATLRFFLSSPSKNDLLLICSTNFHQSPSMCQVHRRQADICQHIFITWWHVPQRKGLPRSHTWGARWVRATMGAAPGKPCSTFKTLLIRGTEGAHPQGWTWLSTPLCIPSGCQRLEWGKPPPWGPPLRRELSPATTLL